jgi:hypothetical protein
LIASPFPRPPPAYSHGAIPSSGHVWSRSRQQHGVASRLLLPWFDRDLVATRIACGPLAKSILLKSILLELVLGGKLSALLCVE